MDDTPSVANWQLFGQKPKSLCFAVAKTVALVATA